MNSNTRAATVLLSLLALVAGLMATVSLAPSAHAVPSGNVIVDPTWQPQGGLGYLLATSVLQPDGKLIVAGPFTSVNGVRRVTVARLNPDGTLDPSFDVGDGFDGPIRTLALQPDGKILAGGVFAYVDGILRPGIVRLLTDGNVDLTFQARASAAPSQATAPATANRRSATAWTGSAAARQFQSEPESAAGAVRGSDLVGTSAGDSVVQGIAVQPDGRVIVYGSQLNYDGSMNMSLGRLNSDGTHDPTFDAPYVRGQIIGDAITRPDGTTVVSGYDYLASQPILARLRENGSVDPTWVASACNGPVWELEPLADGRILAAGAFTTCGGAGQRGMVRLLPTGAVDPLFSTGAGFDRNGAPMGPDDVVVMPDGQLAAVGYFTSVDGSVRPGIAMLGAAGALAAGYSPAPLAGPVGGSLEAYAWQAQAQPGGGLIILGLFGSVGGVPRTGLARLNADGALDASYAPVLLQGAGVDSWASDAVVQPDGKVMVTGGFATYNGSLSRALVRLNPNGTRDATFSTEGTGLAFADAVVQQPDGKYVVAGAVAVSATAVVLAVLRLNPDGSRDPSFAAQRYDLAQDQQFVNTMVLQPDGKVLVAGQFTGPGGRANLMRLGSNGAPDPGFAIGTGFTHSALGLLGVRALVLQPDGRIVAAGAFTAVNGVARSGIVRLQPGGGVDPSFNPGAGFTGTQAMVRALVPAPGGRLWAAGRFDFYNGQPRQSIVRINGNGSLDASFVPAGQFLQPWLPTEVTLSSLVGQPDGKVITTGSFVTFGGVSRPGILRLTAAGALDATFDPGSGFADPSYVTRMLPQANGAIVAVGQFQGFNDVVPAPMGVTRLVVVSAPPGAPTGVSVTNGDGAVLVTCTPPDPGAGGAAQRYEFSTDDGATWPVSSSSPAAALGGLVNGQVYQVRVRAVNLVGTGPASAAVEGRPVVPVGSVFVPVTPVRVVDSRVVFGGVGPVVAGSSRVVSVAAPAGGGPAVVPVGAVAVAYNLTVPGPGSAGHVRVMPGDAVGLTSASAINFRARETIANAATVKVAPDRTVKVYAGSTADVIIDVVGYFVPAAVGDGPVPSAAAAGRFTPVTPVRVYDAAADPGGLLAGGADRLVSTASTQAGGVPVVPVGASAVAYNVTVVETAGAGHVRVMPGDVASSSTSAINWSTAGERIANGSVVGVDADRQIRVFNGGGAPVRFLVDVVGYYSQAGQEFFPVDPVRTTDTRYAQGGAGPVAPVLPGARAVSVAATQAGGMAVVPAGVSAVAFNATVVATGSMGHLRVFPANAVLPTASVLNWPAAGYTRANATAVGVSPERQVTLYNGAGTPTDVLIDINGYYQ